MSPELRMCLFILLLLFASCSNYAATITVTFNISQADVSSGYGGEDPDLYAKININNTGFADTPTHNNLESLPATFTDMKRSLALNLGTLTSYSIPIVVQLWDEDGGAFGDDDKLDISPIGVDLDLNYDLRTRTYSGDTSISPSTGSNGTIWFDILSPAFQYHNWKLSSSWKILGLPGAGALYEVTYRVENLSTNTFDVNDFYFFDVTNYDKFGFIDIGPALLPGESYSWTNRGNRLFFANNVQSGVSLSDLDKTQSFQNWGLFYAATVPEPSMIGLLSIGLISFLRIRLWRRET